MAHPSPSALEALRARVTDWSATDEALVAALNAPDRPNPTPQGTVPAPLSESALLALLTDPTNGSLVRLVEWPNFGLLKADIAAQNRAGVLLWAQALAAAGLIAPGEAGALSAYVQGTEPDPSWPAEVSWAEATLGRSVDGDDIREARP
jgi:hypothetical protein